MTLREMNLAVFQGKPIPHVLFQPRIEPWHAWHEKFGKTPPRWKGVSMLGMFDQLGVSMRYVHYYTGQPNPFRMVYDAKVKIEKTETATEQTEVFHTPLGELVIRNEMTIDGEWRETGFPVADERDLKKLLWLYQHARFEWLPDNFTQGAAFMGDRGIPQF